MHPNLRVSLAAALTLFGALVLSSQTAHAGACPTCTTNAECEALFPGEPAFCVLHDDDVGCGSARQLCCPGQGCSTASGRPSCEAAGTCSVVGGAETDAGTATTDAGTALVDSGAIVPDAAMFARDGGASDVARAGCACRAGGATGAQGAIALCGVAIVALALRRRAR